MVVISDVRGFKGRRTRLDARGRTGRAPYLAISSFASTETCLFVFCAEAMCQSMMIWVALGFVWSVEVGVVWVNLTSLSTLDDKYTEYFQLEKHTLNTVVISVVVINKTDLNYVWILFLESYAIRTEKHTTVNIIIHKIKYLLWSQASIIWFVINCE